MKQISKNVFIYNENTPTKKEESKEIKSVQNNIGNDIMKYGIDDYFYSLFKTVGSLLDSMSIEGKQKQGNEFGKILDHLGSAGTAATKISMDRKYWNKGN